MGIKPQEIIDRLNRVEDWRELGLELESQWEHTASLIGLLDQVDPAASEFLRSWPEELLDGVAAVAGAAARTGARLRWAWTPGYDFAVTIAKANYRKGDPEYTISCTSRYPDEVRRPERTG